MKYSLAALVALASASTALAVTLGTAPAVTVALTASVTTGSFRGVDPYTGDVTNEISRSTEGRPDKNGNVITTTEYKSTIGVSRYGNAELINELKAAGLLPDGVVKGWSIVLVRPIGGWVVGALYAVKKGQIPVSIETEWGNDYYALAITGKETSDSTGLTETLSMNYTGKEIGHVEFAGFALDGIISYTRKFIKGAIGKGTNATPFADEVNGVTILAGISGSRDIQNDGLGGRVVEGSMSIAAEIMIDLDTLGISLVQQ